MRRKSVCVLGAVVLAGPAAAAVPFARSASEQAGGTQDGKSGESGAGSRSEGTVPPIAKVADALYIIQGQSGKTAMRGAANGVVLVDPVTPENGQTLFDVVKSVTDKPVTHVIITHAHVYNTHTDIISTHLAGGVTGGQTR